MAKPVSKKEGAPRQPDNNDALIAELSKRISSVVGRGQADQVISQVVALFQEERFSGPIAHPRHLREYEEILPGSADRIIGMAERSLRHSHEMNEKVLDAEIADTRSGRRYGFAALLALIGAALICALMGRELLAGAFLGTGIVGVIGIFVRGRLNSSD